MEEKQPIGRSQQLFYDNDVDRYIGFRGGYASGKSTIGALKLLTVHLKNNNPIALVPSAIVTHTWESMWTINIPIVKTIAQELGLDMVLHKTKRYIYFPQLGVGKQRNKIHLFTATSSSIGCPDLGSIWFDECFNKDNAQILQLLPYLRHAEAKTLQALFTWTPEDIAMEDLAESINMKIYTGSTADNVYVEHYYKKVKNRLSPKLARQYLDGQLEE